MGDDAGAGADAAPGRFSLIVLGWEAGISDGAEKAASSEMREVIFFSMAAGAGASGAGAGEIAEAIGVVVGIAIGGIGAVAEDTLMRDVTFLAASAWEISMPLATLAVCDSGCTTGGWVFSGGFSVTGFAASPGRRSVGRLMIGGCGVMGEALASGAAPGAAAGAAGVMVLKGLCFGGADTVSWVMGSSAIMSSSFG
jgi:hypothetical protein